ncbi:hypothetical protein QBC46DRAFT_385250 [Diplogelasinospora grovesii]|uniref:Uncharacterized protein n=1 Tax=Diplogelasinospora grovesii TaxID=303347 RepID=A0AAN6N992_9PEZI|nr:hypothetical protein QBC46DRAFT_385250 [Diplogelasinospora grovesii]
MSSIYHYLSFFMTVFGWTFCLLLGVCVCVCRVCRRPCGLLRINNTYVNPLTSPVPCLFLVRAWMIIFLGSKPGKTPKE